MATQTTQGKVALVLAGGGLTGAVYELGALRAIDDLLLDRTVNDFDIYVGTSAGSLVASGLVNGLSPVEMLRLIEGMQTEIEPIQPRQLFNLDYQALLRSGVRMPARMVKNWARYLLNQDDTTLFDVLWSTTEALPAGLYDGMALEKYIRVLLCSPGCSNRFTMLRRELYIIATDLDNGERAVFGQGDLRDIPISMAVAASSALPIVYKPVRIGQREYVDGGLRGNASLDLAIENGAKLIVCINPMVPYDNTPNLAASPKNRLSGRGMQPVTAQITRIITHASLHYHIKQLRRQHPDVDILVIEPRATDPAMFFHNVMRYSARLTIARHGFESVTLDLAEDYPAIKEMLSRHGIPISRRLVIDELAEIQRSGYDPEIVQQVLEGRANPCNRYQEENVACQLTKALEQLEMTLEAF